MKKFTGFVVLFLVGFMAFGSVQDFDSAYRELRHNFNFIDSYERASISTDTYTTIIFNDNTGLAYLIEQTPVFTRVTLFAKAGNKEANEMAERFCARELNGGSMNIVAIGLASMDGIRLIKI